MSESLDELHERARVLLAEMPPLELPDPAESDAKLAARLSIELRDRWAFTQNGWLRSDGSVWRSALEVEITATCAGLIQGVAADVMNPKTRARMESFRAAEGAVRSLRGLLFEDITEFDADPWLLNCPNGVVDLRTGNLRAHNPLHRFTKQTDVDYDPAAHSEDWKAALSALGDDETARWFQVMAGQAITGTPGTQALILHGDGANGKSLILDGLLNALGSYAAVVPPRLLLADTGAHPVEKMSLLGLRLAVAEELPEGRYVRAETLKQITDTGRINARLIRGNNVEFDATHSMFITTNYSLRMAESDHGSWRRLAIVPFPYRYVNAPADLLRENERPADVTLKDRLRQGDPAALAWAVRGAMIVHRSPHLTREDMRPESITKASADTRAESDIVEMFIADVCELVPDEFVARTALYATFKEYCSTEGVGAMQARNFRGRLETIATRDGLFQAKDVRYQNQRGYRGIRVNPSWATHLSS